MTVLHELEVALTDTGVMMVELLSSWDEVDSVTIAVTRPKP